VRPSTEAGSSGKAITADTAASTQIATHAVRRQPTDWARKSAGTHPAAYTTASSPNG
jgi:hypothetical protein